MKRGNNGLIYEGIINAFFCAKWLMKQRPQIKSVHNLENLPQQLIFTITHDSYFEIPSLSAVYKAISPRPVFTVMAKEDFLSGNYLSTNFFKENKLLQRVFKLLDKSGAPKAVFEKLNLISIPRPFADLNSADGKNVKDQIASQFSQFKDRISEGFSTLIFPEGTTWGYGGLRKIRSAVYQLVSTSFEQHGKKIYILPINVKVDKLVKGWKDVFINIGAPEFFMKSKEEFNLYLHQVLLQLHTITFSQIAAYHLKNLAEKGEQSKTDIKLAKDQLIDHLEYAVHNLHKRVKEGILPDIDQQLTDHHYFTDKIERFVHYCERKNYLVKLPERQTYRLNSKILLSLYPKKLFRRKNPMAYHANELASLGEPVIKTAFNR